MGFALERVDAAGADKAMDGLELMGRPRNADVYAGKQAAVGEVRGVTEV
jgi:hypothetical protein